jgi:hypothetical protein
MVCWSVVDEEQDAIPSFEYEFEESDEISLSFMLAKCVSESFLCSCTEHVSANILVID